MVRSQSPPESDLNQRGRQLGSKSNGRKKGVIVLKKESINRQNSFSRSPEHALQQLNNSLGSPYHSPKASEIEKYKGKAVKGGHSG